MTPYEAAKYLIEHNVRFRSSADDLGRTPRVLLSVGQGDGMLSVALPSDEWEHSVGGAHALLSLAYALRKQRT